MTFRLACPACGRMLDLDDAAEGTVRRCPGCRESFSVPHAGEVSQAIPVASIGGPPAGAMPRLGGPVSARPAPTGAAAGAPPTVAIPNHRTHAIVTLVLGAHLFGILAIVQSVEVDNRLQQGDKEGALKASAQARKWCWIGTVADLVQIPVVVMLMLNQ